MKRSFPYRSMMLFAVIFLCFGNTAMSQWEKLEQPYGEYIKSLSTTGDALFAAGDYLYSSYDYGRSWSRVQTLPETPPMILYAYVGYLFAGTYRHLYRSTTNGMNWTNLTLPDSIFTLTTICRNLGTLIVHVGTTTGDKIYLSEDNGDTWQLPDITIPTNRIGGLHEISGAVYACTAVGIYRSFDRGHHWEVFTPLITTMEDDDNGMAYANQRFIVATWWGILTSPDGVSWDTVRREDIKPQCMMVIDSSGNGGQRILMGTAGYGYGGNLHGLFYSDNNGADLFPLTDVNTRNDEVTCILKCDSGLFVGTTSDGVLRSRDNGVSWQVSNTGMSERFIHQIAADDRTLVVSDGNKETVLFVSTDRGASWQYHGLNRVSDDPWVNDILVQDDRLWVATCKGLFTKKITDTAWVVYWPDSVFRFLAKAGQTIWAAPSYSLLKTVNAGQTWTNCPWTAGLHGYIEGMSANDQAVVVLAEEFVTRSMDGGDHFLSSPFPGSEHYLRFMTNDGTDFYVFSDGKGVYRSDNNGKDWELAKDTGFYELKGVAANASVIIIASGIGGVIRSTDKGQTWRRYNEGFQSNIWEASGVALSGDTAYITAYYRWVPGVGIWKRSSFPAGIPEQNSHERRLQIHPNPASGWIFISAEHEVCLGAPFTVTDINGQIMRSGVIGADGSIPVSDLCPGAFFVVIRFHSKQYSGQFIRK
ncbi:MAG: T9SS type A sorting domain-containing protein [Bacteroidales bacterium]|nr:T9SS type A sorting domain-containing protein [Bacteroidales bacterium]